MNFKTRIQTSLSSTGCAFNYSIVALSFYCCFEKKDKSFVFKTISERERVFGGGTNVALLRVLENASN